MKLVLHVRTIWKYDTSVRLTLISLLERVQTRGGGGGVQTLHCDLMTCFRWPTSCLCRSWLKEWHFKKQRAAKKKSTSFKAQITKRESKTDTFWWSITFSSWGVGDMEGETYWHSAHSLSTTLSVCPSRQRLSSVVFLVRKFQLLLRSLRENQKWRKKKDIITAIIIIILLLN